jgi:hypothetical protein
MRVYTKNWKKEDAVQNVKCNRAGGGEGGGGGCCWEEGGCYERSTPASNQDKRIPERPPSLLVPVEERAEEREVLGMA